ncbi:MAG: restriction endonuclease subunit S, partial [Ruminococcus sp.]|nr:restriction endonuclease subunit S [Ruminococcus sp.]
PVCIADEVPFEIPDSWEWVRLKNIAVVNPRNIEPDCLDTGFIPMPLLMDGYRSEHTFETRKWKDIKSGFTHFCNNDIVIAKISPCFQNRKSAIIHELPNGIGAGTTELHVVRKICNHISNEYLLLIFKSAYFIDNGVKTFSGTAGQQRVSKDYVENLLVPIPPLVEQKQIVKKANTVLPLSDRYTANFNKFSIIQRDFPDQLKKSILQQAVQGKLVPQDENDEPASVLLERIRAEKQKLIKEGKIKRDKHESLIFRRDNSHYEIIDGKERCIDDELPFEIPDSWEWVRLVNVASILGGKRIPAGRKLSTEDTGHIYIRVSDMKNHTVNMDSLLYVPNDIYPLISKYIISKDDIYITVAGTIGAVGKIPVELDGANLTENAARIVFKITNQNWLIDYLCSPFVQSQIADATTKVGQPKLAIKRIKNLLVALPPLAEQQRIVEKVDELLSAVKRL